MTSRLTILNLLALTTLVAFSMWLMSGEGYSDLAGAEKVFVAFFASMLVMCWGEHQRQYEDKLSEITGEPSCRLGGAFVTCLYGWPGCNAGCWLGYEIFRPTLLSLLFIPVLIGVYIATHGVFQPPSVAFSKFHLEGMNGDGI